MTKDRIRPHRHRANNHSGNVASKVLSLVVDDLIGTEAPYQRDSISGQGRVVGMVTLGSDPAFRSAGSERFSKRLTGEFPRQQDCI